MPADEILIRQEGRAGRITLNRPDALNALTYDMCLSIEKALDTWRHDPQIALVLITGAGDRAFCAGGDIQKLYDTGIAGDFAYGQQFWADEYRMNAKIAGYEKPIVSFLQGFTMGGGVGVGCHGSHRIVCETTQIAMPECGIGLLPDVGGSYLLMKAPGRMGEYLGLTAYRMGPGAALYAGFADHFIPADAWPDLIQQLEATGDVDIIASSAKHPPASALPGLQSKVDVCFGGETFSDILHAIDAFDDAFSDETLRKMQRNDPLAMACTVALLHHLRAQNASMPAALEMEYRFTSRAMEHGDFLEGIRAAIIEKDKSPKWRHRLSDVPQDKVNAMLAPVENSMLRLEDN
ncbi:enoyl-CoA hydratase/isomerase family protein [Rhodalgimonas zhirmunskyi]|uniref:3-hydroxyisobutyryl-CoA hydrolase n=1 Tax=Rhodalgimonas zhirmunskyi TaxID=2964767 RepID=A0AAJ1UG12_9RHOB|nr:enoyl-CoA hydratase/isomerase family protein [Rhodoalgimonas zhirmunskyi]MDQ2095237.1 enoyl-CoA hydratase/isomerase family protein [Rhodoalgimonas zhirmunskyi]